jgi:hypothetical protein
MTMNRSIAGRDQRPINGATPSFVRSLSQLNGYGPGYREEIEALLWSKRHRLHRLAISHESFSLSVLAQKC